MKYENAWPAYPMAPMPASMASPFPAAAPRRARRARTHMIAAAMEKRSRSRVEVSTPEANATRAKIGSVPKHTAEAAT